MSKKISVSEFISDKKIKQIEKIISKSASTEDAYDKIENLLIDDFTVKDLGTNRLVLIHNKNKKYICKIAGDSHGIEANYREFYNGDLDESRITKSYSISENGVFLVQEKVIPFDSKTMKKRKKDVRKMLSGLENKILLVDCKLSNFKNFGVRKNGNVVLLDHGDTIPLTMYDNGKIVNIIEESNVSLRCKDYKKGTISTKNPQPCGGKLVYSKDYDYFTCKKCGAKSSIHDAYKEFYGYTRSNVGDSRMLTTFQDGFDPKEYERQIKESIKQYAKDTMNKVDTKNKKENKEMDKKINGQKCQQIKGYWLPVKSDKAFASAKLMMVKKGDMEPKEYLKFLGLDPDEYKMNAEDHQNSKVEKGITNKKVSEITDIVLSWARSNTDYKVFDGESSKRNGLFKKVSLEDLEIYGYEDVRKYVFDIHKCIKKADDVIGAFFDKEYLYIKFKPVPVPEDFNPEYVDNEIPKAYDVDEDEPEEISHDTEYDESNDNDEENEIMVIPFKDFMSLETEMYIDIDCVSYEGYFIPIDVVNRYYNSESGNFEFPNPVKMLSDNGYEPNLFEITKSSANNNEDLKSSEDEIENNDEFIEESDIDYEDEDSDELDYDFINRHKFAENLSNTLDALGYDDYGYAEIPYDTLAKLLIRFGFDQYLDDNNELNEDGFDFIRSFDYVTNIDDYVYHKAYDIQVKGKATIFEEVVPKEGLDDDIDDDDLDYDDEDYYPETYNDQQEYDEELDSESSSNEESDHSMTDIETTNKNSFVESSNDKADILNNIIAVALSGLDTLVLNLDDIKDKIFEIRKGYGDTVKIAHINLYEVIEPKFRGED